MFYLMLCLKNVTIIWRQAKKNSSLHYAFAACEWIDGWVGYDLRHSWSALFIHLHFRKTITTAMSCTEIRFAYLHLFDAVADAVTVTIVVVGDATRR